jgi:hypothetical protein
MLDKENGVHAALSSISGRQTKSQVLTPPIHVLLTVRKNAQVKNVEMVIIELMAFAIKMDAILTHIDLVFMISLEKGRQLTPRRNSL